MPEIILHAGLHKTGSSSIQASLKGFDKSGIRYLRLGFANHSVPIVTVFSNKRYEYHPHRHNGHSHAEVDRIRKSVIQKISEELTLDREKLIISGEDLSSLEEAEVVDLREFLAKFSKNIKVIIYVRDPKSFVSSAHQTHIKIGLKAPSIRPPRYRQKIEKFINVFGRDQVTVRQFRPELLAGRSVVSDFCEYAGIDFTSVDEIRANDSVSLPAARIIHDANCNGMAWKGDPSIVAARRRAVARIGKEIKGEKFSLPAEFAASIFEDDDIQWLKDMTGIDYSSSRSANSAKSANTANNLQTTDFLEPTSNDRKALVALASALEIPIPDNPSIPNIVDRMICHQVAEDFANHPTELPRLNFFLLRLDYLSHHLLSKFPFLTIKARNRFLGAAEKRLAKLNSLLDQN